MGRGALALSLGLALLASQADAHSRERRRLDELEEALNERTALLTQGVKDALDATTRQQEALQERQQHADFLAGKIQDLRSDVDAGLQRVRDSIGTTVAPTLQTLEESLEAHTESRLETRLGELALAQSQTREEALARVATRLSALEAGATTSEQARGEMGRELQTLRTSLGEFRSYLESFTGSVDARLKGLDEDLAALRAEAMDAARQRQATDQRLAALLQAMDQENQKVRRALAQLAGDDSTDVYVVQRGDSLYGIARQHDIPLPALEAANPGFAKTGIHPGDRVVIPPK